MKICYENSNEKVVKKQITEILSGQAPFYLLGRNNWSADIAKQIEPVAFIDEFTDEKVYLKKTILRDLSLLDENAIVISCSMLRPITAKKSIISKGVRFLDYFAFWRYSNLSLIDPYGWRKFRESFDPVKYENIFRHLHDDISKRTLEDIVNFRLTQNLDFMGNYKDNQENQYFEDFLGLDRGDQESFVDAGGFDGSTTKMFLDKTENVGRVYFFEPDSDNMKIAKANLSEHKYSGVIEYFECGLGKSNTTVRFNSNGSASNISNDGSKEIRIRKLDDVLKDKKCTATFIKMDVEGAEQDLLTGASGIIADYRPKIAVSVYHKPDDMLEIYEYVMSLYSGYKVYLRHYTEGITETVMFFVPE